MHLIESDLGRLRALLVHVVDPDFGEVAGDNPAGPLIEDELAVVALGLLERRQLDVAGVVNLLVQADAQALLLNQGAGLRDVHVDALGVAVDDDFLLEVHALGDVVHAEDVGQKVNPVGSAVFVFSAPASPSVDELAGRFSLFCVGHGWVPPLIIYMVQDIFQAGNSVASYQALGLVK